MPNKLHCKASAFSLIQLSGIVLAAGLVAAAVIPEGGGESNASRYLTTIKRMEKIEDASVKMMAVEGRRPCPASGEYYPGHAKFGKEDGTAGDCADSGATDGVLTPFDDTNVIGGTVPSTTLNLPQEYYFDGWGRPFTYAVDKRATDPLECVQIVGSGEVEIYPTDGGTKIDSTMYTLISHGPDGHGAFLPGGSTRTNRIDAGSTDADQRNNAGASGVANFSTTPYKNEWVKKETGANYDDVTWYSERRKNTCCVGKECGENIAALAPPPPVPDACPPNVLRLTGNSYNYLARVVVGDINGDGLDDAFVNGEGGGDYVLFGSTTGWALNGSFNIGSTLLGSNGFTVTGSSSSSDVALGDVNGDGYDDIVLVDSSNVRIIFGGTGPKTGPSSWDSAWPSFFDVGAINGTNGATVTKGAGQTGYFSKVVIGNVDGNGYEDILFSQLGGNSSRGHMHLLLGRATWPSSQTNTAYLNGTDGFRFDGWENNDGSGYDVTYPTVTFGLALGMVDFDNDGLDDMVMASQGQQASPQTFQMQQMVIYGNSDPATKWSSTNEIEFIASGDRWWTYYPTWGGVPYYMARGDLNNDSVDDFAIRIGGYGAAVFYGSSTRNTSQHVDLRTYLNGTNGFYRWQTNYGSPYVADVNGDGKSDLMEVSGYYYLFASVSYQPSAGGYPSTGSGKTDADVLLDWSGANYEFGYGGAAADINADGYMDILVTGRQSNFDGGTYNGALYITWGGAGGFPSSFDPINIPVTTCSE